jgi:primosomal protein N' (replication factor Y) (superfamily II helicase)
MKPCYADIAVPGVPRAHLTYGVPEGIAAGLEPGCRVIVPLGRRLVPGFLLRMHDVQPEYVVKAVQEVLDARPALTPDVMRLCAWMASYYICPLGDALKAALPQGMDPGTERHVSLATDDEDLITQAVGRSALKRQIMTSLSTGEVATEDMLRVAAGVPSISAQLRDLERAGAIRCETVLEAPRARPKLILAVRLLAPWQEDARFQELVALLERRAPKQVNVLTVLRQALRAGRRTMPMSELARAAHATQAQVRALEDKEIVEVLEEEAPREWESTFEEAPREISLTDEQRHAVEAVGAAVDEGSFQAFLLHGITASGKTQVYIDAARHAVAAGRTALVLVPEIALTPQVVFRFRLSFGAQVAVQHSRMSIGERYDAWRRAREGAARVIVGVRSAVFAPLEGLGLIVVDEEHEATYKSDQQPRYHARDAAVMRARLEGIPILLGSATPSAESWHNAMEGKYRLLSLPRRIDGATLPTVSTLHMTDLRRQNLLRGALSVPLLEAVGKRIDARELTILLHNRRGFSPHVECRECGHAEGCENCSISMTFHKDRDALRCHYCGAMRRVPVQCAQCGSTQLDRVGIGTQRVEEDLKEALPQARVLRMDLDTTRRKGAHDVMLTAFSEGDADVLLGTQMVAKGLDFPRVTLVGVVSAEQTLLLPDFRASERTFQLLSQVAGRAGRGDRPGQVLVQTAQPEHPVLRLVAAHDYHGFIEEELRSRRRLSYPPFSRLVLCTFTGNGEEDVSRAATLYHESLAREHDFFRMHPPVPALIERINRHYRWQLLLRVDKTRDPANGLLAAALERAAVHAMRRGMSRSVRVVIDVDPNNMM